MPTSYTSLLGLALPVTGELSGTWGDIVNDSITSLLDSSVAGTTTLSTDADVTLTTTSGASNQARQAILLCTGARTVQRTVTAPAQSKAYIVVNATTGGQSVKVVGAGPTTGVTVENGERCLIAWNGSDFVKVAVQNGTGTFTALTASGQITSTVSTGTAPFVVASTTKVSNLNVDQLDGGDWASPGAIGSTTPSTGAFTTLSATTTGAASVDVRRDLQIPGENTLGEFNFRGRYDASNYGVGANITAVGVGSAWSASNTPAYLVVNTVATGSTTLVERARFSSTGLSVTGALSASGDVSSVNNSGQAQLVASSTAASFANVTLKTAGLTRWAIEKSGTESGSNAGGDLNFYRYTDAGGYLGNPLTINRATGLVTANTGLSVTGALSASGEITSTAGSIHLASTKYVGFNGDSTALVGTGNDISLFAGGSNRLTVAGTTGLVSVTNGLSVTGALSVTNPLTVRPATNTAQIVLQQDNTAGSYSTIWRDSSDGALRIGNDVVSGQAVLTSAGNLGLGVTPSAWTSSAKAIEFAYTSYGMDNNGAAFVAFNARNSAPNTWVYKSTDEACKFTATTGGGFTWETAPSGTAGDAISFIERMNLSDVGLANLFTTNQDGFQSKSSASAGTAYATFVGRHSATSTADGAISYIVWNNGNVQNTNNSYGAISDIKLKENITDATPKLAGLMQVRVVNYNLKSDPEHKQIGVIAQELEQVFPGMVEESPDRDAEGEFTGEVTKSVKYSVFVPMLVKAMQEQQRLIEAMEARLSALEAA